VEKTKEKVENKLCQLYRRRKKIIRRSCGTAKNRSRGGRRDFHWKSAVVN
jgi:hypothetical protein